MDCRRTPLWKKAFIDPVAASFTQASTSNPESRGRGFVFGKLRLPALIMRIV
jgi:hypothetical protein